MDLTPYLKDSKKKFTVNVDTRNPFKIKIKLSTKQNNKILNKDKEVNIGFSFDMNPLKKQFEKLDLFLTDIEVLKVFTIYNKKKVKIPITLKQTQTELIKQKAKFIFLRICKVNLKKHEQKDYIPQNIDLLINGCKTSQFFKNSTKKFKTPLDITNRCRITTTKKTNSIEINVQNNEKLVRKGFGVEIILAKKLSVNDSLISLRSNNFIRDENTTLKIIKDNCIGNSDIQCESIKVPLTCPITKKILVLPCIGLKCKHVACFEGQVFLEMNLNKIDWICPVCFNIIRKSELVQDPLIENIIENTNRKIEQIEFDELGNFKVENNENLENKNDKNTECIVLNDDDDDTIIDYEDIKVFGSKTNYKTQNSNSNDIDDCVIILDSDSNVSNNDFKINSADITNASFNSSPSRQSYCRKKSFSESDSSDSRYFLNNDFSDKNMSLSSKTSLSESSSSLSSDKSSLQSSSSSSFESDTDSKSDVSFSKESDSSFSSQDSINSLASLKSL